MAVDFGGIKMKNPVNTAAGTFGQGWQFEPFIDVSELGAITTKGCAAEPWPGNPAPRMCEVPGGMMNSVGLQNPGVRGFAEESELDLEGAELLEAVAGLGAHAWYKNLPKRFVAGCLVDFDSREVVVGAEAVLVDELGAEMARLDTDDFGDFLFDQVEPAAYTVHIAGRELAADVREKDLNLGDIARE